jgi:class 3 adenylate cyclase
MSSEIPLVLAKGTMQNPIATVDELVAWLQSHDETLFVPEYPDGSVNASELWYEYKSITPWIHQARLARPAQIADISTTEALRGLASVLGPIVVPNIGRNFAQEVALAASDEGSELSKVSTRSCYRAFVYFDISDFSTYSPGQQLLVIKSFIKSLKNLDSAFNYHCIGGEANTYETLICIGDGYLFVFKDAFSAAWFAAALASTIQILASRKKVPVEYHFRAGVHYGSVRRFYDPGSNKWNYVGEGVNIGRRVLECIGTDLDDVLYVSDAVHAQILSIRGPDRLMPHDALLKAFSNRGRRKDKHGVMHRVYELAHLQVCPEIA